MELERDIERSFVNTLTVHKCIVFKFVSSGHAGVPDRIVVTPKGNIYFVELKRPNGKLRKLQEWTKRQLLNHNCSVHIVKSTNDIKAFVKMMLMKEGVIVG